MQFVYDALAGKELLEISGDKYQHIFRARRLDRGRFEARLYKSNVTTPKLLKFCNFNDGFLHFYEVVEVFKKSATLKLQNSLSVSKNTGSGHVIWAIVDPKVVERTLPFLNQLGLKKLSLFRAKRSQNFELKDSRLKSILISSSEQCGRFNLLEIEILQDLKEVFLCYQNCILLDFSGEDFKGLDPARSVIIGPEGGFSGSELELAKRYCKIYKLNTEFILKSETATIFSTCLIATNFNF